MRRVVTWGRRDLLDSGDRLVDLERLCDRDAALRAEPVVRQSAKEEGQQNWNDQNYRNVVPTAVTNAKECEGLATREGEPYLMVVTVLLILSASAIAIPPSGPSVFPCKLQTRGGSKLLCLIRMLIPTRSNKLRTSKWR
jgi:hypothetical protein